MLDKKAESFRHAFGGLKIAWREEFSFRFQLTCAGIAILASWIFGLSLFEFAIILFLIGFVLTVETLNTSLEEFCDMVKSDPDPHIAKIKDLAAGAAFIASMTSLAVGAAIFIPHLLPYL